MANINILYCGDKNIADGVIMSALSLMHHVSEPLNIYILTAAVNYNGVTCDALPESFAASFERVVKEANKLNSISLIDITELFMNELPVANMQTRFTPCCMLRLYADKIPQLPNRILYLDNDVICLKNFSDFYYQSIAEYELCGVLDYYGRWFFRNNIFRFDYLNSGVLLLNMDMIRKTGLFASCRDRCRNQQMFMPDQSALNKLTGGKKICDRRYNEQRKLKNLTVFRHFTTSFRVFPWIHAVSVKPWDIANVHKILKTTEFDDLYNEYINTKIDMDKERIYIND